MEVRSNRCLDSPFEDKELLTKLLLDEKRSRDFQAGLMWENLRYFSTLIAALLTADLYLANFLMGARLATWPTVSILFPLPATVFALSVFGERDLGRRWSRILEAIANSVKLEHLLGLNDPVPRLGVFPDDKHLYSERWHKSRANYKGSEDFVKGEMKRPNMYTHMRIVYYFTALVGLGLLVLPFLFA